jgi:peptidoglycan hydrolase-like protein with peptidoglycan-binding domain
VRKQFVFAVAIAIGLAVAGLISADENAGAGWAEENVRLVQMKLHEAGLYFGNIDGAYSSELAAALGRYQIRNGLPITGQLDTETSKALGAKPAVATTANEREKSSETWRQLRTGEQQTSANYRETSSSRTAGAPESGTEIPPRSAPAATTPIYPDTTQPASAPPAITSDTSSPSPNFSMERLRDYVGAFVLAGLDPHVGSETDFFADRVQYYDEGMKDHEKIRKDLQRYAARWPDRRFWLDGDITVEPQSGNRARVTFPLRYDLRNGAKHLSGKINKTLVLEAAGDDLQIVAVNERKAG